MPPTIIAGPETSIQNVDNNVRGMDANVYELEPNVSPLIVAHQTRWVRSHSDNPKAEWLEDEALPARHHRHRHRRDRHVRLAGHARHLPHRRRRPLLRPRLRASSSPRTPPGSVTGTMIGTQTADHGADRVVHRLEREPGRRDAAGDRDPAARHAVQLRRDHPHPVRRHHDRAGHHPLRRRRAGAALEEVRDRARSCDRADVRSSAYAGSTAPRAPPAASSRSSPRTSRPALGVDADRHRLGDVPAVQGFRYGGDTKVAFCSAAGDRRDRGVRHATTCASRTTRPARTASKMSHLRLRAGRGSPRQAQGLDDSAVYKGYVFLVDMDASSSARSATSAQTQPAEGPPGPRLRRGEGRVPLRDLPPGHPRAAPRPADRGSAVVT